MPTTLTLPDMTSAPYKFYFEDDEKAPVELEEGLVRAGEKYDSLTKKEIDILEECERLNDILTENLELAMPVLPIPASKEAALAAKQALVDKHQATLRILEEPRSAIIQRIKGFIRAWGEMRGEYGDPKGLSRFSGQRGKLCTERREQKINGDIQIEHEKAKGSLDAILLQETIHRMLHGQPDKLRRFLLVEHNCFAAHLIRTRSRPVLNDRTQHLHNQHVQRLCQNARFLPAELMTMVYSFCELETCVVLRQVSSDWYTAFNQSEKVLSTKLLGRCPWVALDEELVSWALCVLVFVGRLRRPDKWITTENVLGLFHKRRLSPVKTLVAAELRHGEKLPRSFRTLNEDARVQLENGHLDPFNLKATYDTNDEKHKVIRSDDKELVVEYKGIKITLPPDAVLDNTPKCPEMPPQPVITVHRSYIVVRCTGHHFLMARAKPHYDHSFPFKSPGDYTTVEIGQVFVLLLSWQTFFYDNAGGRFRNYNPHGGTKPVASYNGLIWWANYANIIPTFVDLSRPGEIFYRKDRIVSLSEKVTDDPKEVFPSSRTGYRRFLSRKSEKGMLVVDLATTVVTEIHAPGGEDDVIIPGFLNNKFDVRYMSDETIERYEGGEGILR